MKETCKANSYVSKKGKGVKRRIVYKVSITAIIVLARMYSRIDDQVMADYDSDDLISSEETDSGGSVGPSDA